MAYNTKRLAEFEVTKHEKICIGEGDYNGHKYLDIRRHLIEGDTPTKKGLTCPLDKFPQLLEKLAEIEILGAKLVKKSSKHAASSSPRTKLSLFREESPKRGATA